MSALLAALLTIGSTGPSHEVFKATDPASRPWVYWYFMEGAITKDGLQNDLAEMKKAGIGGAIMLEVNIGIPRGPVKYMSEDWLKLMGFAIQEAKRQGISIAMGTGPGWCGAGGPWVKPEDSMQHLSSSSLEVTGPSTFSGDLPRPKPRDPYFGVNTLTPALKEVWSSFYEDEAVVAVPADEGKEPLKDLDEKALVYRGPYSSGTIRARLLPENASRKGVSKTIDLTGKLKNGRLNWQVPPGKWTILRFGRTLVGTVTRPAPDAGLGFETDKFEPGGIDSHLEQFVGALIKHSGGAVGGSAGLTNLHFDSWEMASQNWSKTFRKRFTQLRGYDPLPYLPVLAGRTVRSVNISERFLWDLRQTAQELVIRNQVERIKAYGRRHGLVLDIEPYDLNPTSDLTMGGLADVPMGEFWTKGHGFSTEYSVDEAVSIGHTNGRTVIGAESFTADDSEAWRQHPGSMKAQTDWALATGINRIVFHRYQHQPDPAAYPGMTMGPYGVHWEATEPWWDMAPAYHAYINRCQYMLKLGRPAGDILYLVPEGAPNVFRPPSDARTGDLQDRREYSYDGCSPETLIEKAKVVRGKIEFPGGAMYRILVLPRSRSMTPRLLHKLRAMTEAGAKIVGNLPTQSPSLQNYPACDQELVKAAKPLKGKWTADTEPVLSHANLEEAQWIWQAVGDPRTAAEPGTVSLEKRFDLPKGAIRSATLLATADNGYRLFVNGAPALEGSDFHQVKGREAASLLKPGTANHLRIEARNDGDSPNPAGAIAKLVIQYQDGKTVTIVTDSSWSGSMALGGWKSGPWNLGEGSLPQEEIYPSYRFVARLLQPTTPPDVYSKGSIRWAHRIIPAGDVYFVGNRSEKPFAGDVVFRATGQPEWWDPMAGSTRRLPKFRTGGTTTSIPISLTGNGSGFVVFRGGKSKQRMGENFPVFEVAATVSGPWSVAFESPLGGPSAKSLTGLVDWSKSEDPELRGFSGKGRYRTEFDGDTFDAIDLGDVRNAAIVKVNGQTIGTAWCAPFRVQLPKGVLQPRGNVLEVTVANLWSNRLIADAALPANQRKANTTWNPYQAASPLQPSGLLGPVRLLRVRKSQS